jgi:hypothetical protein
MESGFLTKNNQKQMSKEKHAVDRTYYHKFSGVCTTAPDHEMMIAYLLDEGVVSVSCNGNDAASLFVNVNDHFAPAADAEDLTYDDIPKLFDMYRKDGYDGVYQYVADKRNIPNKHWREV